MANTQTFEIKGMHCASCVAKVQAALAPFADSVEVTLTPPRATLTNSSADIATLNPALANAGNYTLSPEAPIVASISHASETDAQSWFATYKPLLLIIGYILITTLAIQAATGVFDTHTWMLDFMAGFFLVFSFFKFLDPRGFADSYAMYDLLAMRWRPYGFIYPFIELGLGLAYVLERHPYVTSLVTLVVMLFSSIGVIRAVLNKQKIRCACLGQVFNLPMSTVTIVEDLLMAAMALWMLL